MTTVELEFPLDLTKGAYTNVKYQEGILSSEIRGEVGGEPYYDTKGVYESEVIDIGDKFASFSEMVLERYKEEPVRFSPELSNGEISNDGKTITLPKSNLYGVADKAKDSGKWYWEAKYETGSATLMVGIVKDGAGAAYSLATSKYYYAANGQKYSNGNTAYGAPYVAGDVVSVILDLDLGTIEFWKNGVSQGVAYTDIKTLGLVRPASISGSGNNAVTLLTDKKDFQYSPPEGFQPYGGEEGTSVVKQYTRSSPDGNAWEEYKEVVGGVIQSTTNQYFQVKLELYPTMNEETNIELDFEGRDESEKFSGNKEFLDFVGGLQLKGVYKYAMLPQTWGGAGTLHSKKVMSSQFKRIDSLRVL